MSKIETLKEKYIADADAMASKSRFGYFTLLPSHRAAHTDFADPLHPRDKDGKVVTQPRNIYSGSSSTPQLQKNYFSYTPSAFHGSQYQDPGKHDRQQQLEINKSQEGKEKFRPAKLNKTLMSSAYPYMNPHDPSKDKKNHRNADGKVMTQPSNVLISPQSKISYNKNKQFKYVQCPAKKTVERKPQTEDPQDPFKTGVAHHKVFNSDYQTYFDADVQKQDSKKSLTKVASHEGPFKPSCISKGSPFTPLVYKEEGNGKTKVEKAAKKQNKTEPFKLVKVEEHSKPCPSISLSKVNMLRICR